MTLPPPAEDLEPHEITVDWAAFDNLPAAEKRSLARVCERLEKKAGPPAAAARQKSGLLSIYRSTKTMASLSKN